MSTYSPSHKRYFQKHKKEINEKKTPESRKKYRDTRIHKYYPLFRRLLDNKKNRPCLDCRGWFEPCQMEFDHRPTEFKKYEVGNMKGNSIQTILAEIAKCDIVCSNCHRLRTWQRSNRSKYAQ